MRVCIGDADPVRLGAAARYDPPDPMSTMFRTTPHPASSPSGPLVALAAALLLALAGAAARADDGEALDVLGQLPTRDVDAAVEAAQPAPLTALERSDPRATTVVLATRLDTSVAAVGDAIRPAVVPLVQPTRRPPTSTAARPIPVERAAISTPATRLRLVENQAVDLHAEGLPAPNEPSDDPFRRVLPRAVDPNAIFFGARWGAQDTVQMPLGAAIAVSAQADLLTGAAPLRANVVRRSLRLTAQWDDLDDMAFGLTPGVSRGGGNEFQHYVTGLQASTLDPARAARWRSYLEVSGEKLAPNNVYENSSAQVRAGATYQTSRSTQLDVFVTRGTMDKPDTQSSVGLSMKF
jgi:hypothetical protein